MMGTLVQRPAVAWRDPPFGFAWAARNSLRGEPLRLHSTQQRENPDVPSKTSSSCTVSPAITTAEQVMQQQADLLQRLNTQLRKQLILADSYSCQVQFWYIGRPRRLFELLCEEQHIQVVVRFRRRRLSELHARSQELIESLEVLEHEEIERVQLYKPYFSGMRLTHGIHNAIHILFPKLHTSTQHYVVCGAKQNQTFVQTSLAAHEADHLPEADFYGHRFRTLPNLRSILDTSVIPAKLDLVYTWVDNTDPIWSAAFASRTGRGYGTMDALSPARFRNHRELMYSLRSAGMYMRGLRTIYVVTSGQRPDFELPRNIDVRFIDHREIFKQPTHLPTFNSHAIEANLHRILGLSSKYLYLNDDMFFGRTVVPSHFFDQYGRSHYFLSAYATIPSHDITESDLGANAAARNAQRLLLHTFGVFVTRKFWHTAVAIDQDVMLEMEHRFPWVFDQTSASTVRGVNDFAISGNFYCHYAAVTGKGCQGQMTYQYVSLEKRALQKRLAKTIGASDEHRRPDMLCINDVVADIPEENDMVMEQALRNAYPLSADGQGELNSL